MADRMDPGILQSIGRQFIELAMGKEQAIQVANQLEQVANKLAREAHELKCKLSKYETVEGYKDGKVVGEATSILPSTNAPASEVAKES